MSPLFKKLPRTPHTHSRVSFFFYQGTERAPAEECQCLAARHDLRLLCQQPFLISYGYDTYYGTGQSLFDDAVHTLSQALGSMLRDKRFAKGCYMIVAALDESVTHLQQLLNFAVQSVSTTARVKGIMSSRNRVVVDQQLRFNGSQTRLTQAEYPSITETIQYAHQPQNIWPLHAGNLDDTWRKRADGSCLGTWKCSIEELSHGFQLVYLRKMIQSQNVPLASIQLCRNAIQTWRDTPANSSSGSYRQSTHVTRVDMAASLPKVLISQLSTAKLHLDRLCK